MNPFDHHLQQRLTNVEGSISSMRLRRDEILRENEANDIAQLSNDLALKEYVSLFEKETKLCKLSDRISKILNNMQKIIDNEK